MIKKYYLIASLILSTFLVSCSENYSNGERIGLVTQFSKTGMIYKTHEGHLNVTQTGMNSSIPFDFSIDRGNEDINTIKVIDSAAQFGWKVKLVYHQTLFKNWFNNRGCTNHFINKVEVLDKHFGVNNNQSGKIIDTVYVVLDASKLKAKNAN